MIENTEEKAIAIYGTGDIQMNSTARLVDGFVDVHLCQVEPGAIGIIQRPNHQETIVAELNTKILLKFNKVESIDAVIFQLNQAKEVLNNSK